MRDNVLKRSTTFVGALVLALAVGCANSHSAAPQAGPAVIKTIAPLAAPAPSLANGKSIYQTGRDVGGAQIAAQHPPLYANCAACHHANGSGGMHLPGGAVSADLRYKALVTGQKKPYTQALLERAISTGIDNNGEALNPVMPRWKLSPRDLHDVAYYLRTQLK
jgi:mono/diheme cytochrome c family protein